MADDARVPSCCRTVCFNDAKIAELKRALPDAERMEQIAAWHKVLGHPVRLAIVRVLELEECCVCDLANVLDEPVSTISQHLKSLRHAGLVAARQEGKLVICALAVSDLWQALTPVSLTHVEA